MADQLQLRGGTTAEHSTFTGALREVTVDTTKDTVVVHDNATAGGHPLAKEDLSNVAAATAATKLANQTVAFNAGAAGTPSVTFSGDTNTGIYSPGADQVAISTNGTGRLFVDSSGRLGVGTSSPANGRLNVSAAANQITLDTGDTATYGRLDIGHLTSGTFIGTYAGSNTASDLIRFGTGGTERMRLDSSGRLGVGTSSPAALCHLRSDADGAVTHLYLQNRNAGASAQSRISFTDSANDFADNRHAYIGTVTTGAGQNGNNFVIATNPNGGSAQERVWVSSTGNVGIGTTNPTDQLHVVGNILAIASSGNRYVEAKSGSSGVQLACDGNTNFIYGYGAIPLTFSTNGGEKARITSDGKLLVGTSSARSNFFNTSWTPRLQIEGTSDTTSAQALICNSSDIYSSSIQFAKSRGATIGSNTVVQANDYLGSIGFQGSDGTEFVSGASIEAFVDGTPGANDMPGRLVFSTTADGASSPTERMSIRNDGQVWINKTSTTNNARLEVAASASGGTCIATVQIDANTRTHLAVFNSNGLVGQISSNGSATSYQTSSDYRLKENVAPLTGAAARVKQLKPSRFNFIADPSTAVDGFIAHEVQAVVPEAIGGTKDEVDADGNPVYQGIDQSKLVPLLTAALQEALAKIETLEVKVAALESA